MESFTVPFGSNEANRYQTVSLFSGAMGMDIGLESSGRFVTRAAVEKVPAFCQTILVNRDSGRTVDPNLWVFQGDVSSLSPERMLEDIGFASGHVDLLTGGPPCQSFSTTGRRGTVQDPRGTLLWQFLRFVEALQPKFFLMENVRGLMSAAIRHRPIRHRPDKGGPPLEWDEMPGSVVRRFIDDLHGEYRLDIFEVNAVNYGAPQLRERVIFVGNRLNHLVEFPGPTHGPTRETPAGSAEMQLFTGDDRHLLPYNTLGEALDGLEDRRPVLLDFSPRKKRYLEMIPPGSNWRSMPVDVAMESMGKAYFAKGGRSGYWRRLSFGLPSPTIVTMPNHASTALCHPTETRALTLRECARVQEFPDEWQFFGTPAEQFAQVGNAVPVRLGAIAGQLLASHLDKAYAEGLKSEVGAHPQIRQVYLNSHVRTRQWFKAGKTYVWGREDASYSPQRTPRHERADL